MNTNVVDKKTEKEKVEEIPYKQIPAEPTEREKESSEENSHFEDEEGNIYNYDDLTNEEKMLIIQQKIILQKLQEEAEARGEHFDIQEYFAQLAEQSEEDDEYGQQENKSDNKLNKSF